MMMSLSKGNIYESPQQNPLASCTWDTLLWELSPYYPHMLQVINLSSLCLLVVLIGFALAEM
jgi:hypothetical protein